MATVGELGEVAGVPEVTAGHVVVKVQFSHQQGRVDLQLGQKGKVKFDFLSK